MTKYCNGCDVLTKDTYMPTCSEPDLVFDVWFCCKRESMIQYYLGDDDQIERPDFCPKEEPMAKHCSMRCPYINLPNETNRGAFCANDVVTHRTGSVTLAGDDHGWLRDPDCPFSDFDLSQIEAEAIEDDMTEHLNPIADHIVVEHIHRSACFADGSFFDLQTETITVRRTDITSTTQRSVGVSWENHPDRPGRRIRHENRLVLHMRDGMTYTITATMEEWIAFLNWCSTDDRIGYDK